MTTKRVGTTVSGWCLAKQHGEACKASSCTCLCHGVKK